MGKRKMTEEAISESLNYGLDPDIYYLGGLCSRGHVHCNSGKSKRHVSNGHCVECRKLYRRAHGDHIREYNKCGLHHMKQILHTGARWKLPRTLHTPVEELVPWPLFDGIKHIESMMPEGKDITNYSKTLVIHHILPHQFFNFSGCQTDVELVKEFRRFNTLDNLFVTSHKNHKRLHRDMRQKHEKFEVLFKTLKMAIQFEEDLAVSCS